MRIITPQISGGGDEIGAERLKSRMKNAAGSRLGAGKASSAGSRGGHREYSELLVELKNAKAAAVCEGEEVKPKDEVNYDHHAVKHYNYE